LFNQICVEWNLKYDDNIEYYKTEDKDVRTFLEGQMRVTATEYGTSGNSEMVRAYQRIYTQPLHNYLISKAFRLWVTCAWRVYALKDKIVWKDEDLLGSLIRVEIKEHYLSVRISKKSA